MIHDAQVEVTCDGLDCNASTFIDLPYVYGGVNHTFGHYDSKDRTIWNLLKKQDWHVSNERTYCSDACLESVEEE